MLCHVNALKEGSRIANTNTLHTVIYNLIRFSFTKQQLSLDK